MKYYYKTKEREITNYEQWKQMFEENDPSNWKEGRSAQSLASFIMRTAGEGERIIREAVNNVLKNDEINSLDYGIVEYESRFDSLGKGRMQDVAIWGETKSHKTIHIAIEAKVTEEFGPTIAGALKEAESALSKNSKSKKKERILKLSENIFNVSPNTISKLRYQLLHYTAGTKNVDADIHVMLILVFKTEDYYKQADKAINNRRDFYLFMESLGTMIDANSYELTEVSNDFYVIYSDINLKNDPSSHQ